MSDFDVFLESKDLQAIDVIRKCLDVLEALEHKPSDKPFVDVCKGVIKKYLAKH